MALGTVAVSPVELAAAYTAVRRASARECARASSCAWRREDGRVLWQADEPERKHVLDAAVAYVVTDALEDVLTRGTGHGGARCRLPRARRGQDRHHQRRRGHLVRRLHAGDRGRGVDGLRPPAADHGQGHRRTAGRAGVGAPDVADLFRPQGARRPGPMPAGVDGGPGRSADGPAPGVRMRAVVGVAYKELFVHGRGAGLGLPEPGPDHDRGDAAAAAARRTTRKGWRPASRSKSCRRRVTPGGEPVRAWRTGRPRREPMRSYHAAGPGARSERGRARRRVRPAPAAAPAPSPRAAATGSGARRVAPTTGRTAPAPAGRRAAPASRNDEPAREAPRDPAPSPTPSPGLQP